MIDAWWTWLLTLIPWPSSWICRSFIPPSLTVTTMDLDPASRLFSTSSCWDDDVHRWRMMMMSDEWWWTLPWRHWQAWLQLLQLQYDWLHLSQGVESWVLHHPFCLQREGRKLRIRLWLHSMMTIPLHHTFGTFHLSTRPSGIGLPYLKLHHLHSCCTETPEVGWWWAEIMLML